MLASVAPKACRHMLAPKGMPAHMLASVALKVCSHMLALSAMLAHACS